MPDLNFNLKQWADPDDPEWMNHPWRKVFNERTEFVKSFCKDAVVLDAGCGVGWSTERIANVAKRIIAVDLCKDALKIARNRHAGYNIIYKQMNVLSIEIPDNSVDVAVSLEVIEHFDKKDVIKYLSEINRVLKSDGIIVGSTPLIHSFFNARLVPFGIDQKGHKILYTKRGLAKLLKSYFKNVAVFPKREFYSLFFGKK